MTAPVLTLVSSNATPEPVPLPTDVAVVRVAHCYGRTWVYSPRRRTVYVLASGSPAEIAGRIAEGLAAAHAHERRAALTLVAGGGCGQ